MAALGNQVLQSGVRAAAIRIERMVAVVALAGYSGWNVYWLARGQVPPSLWVAATGTPCPTTGGCRSLMALARADLVGSLYWNPMTVPLVAMLAGTAVFVIHDLARARTPAFSDRYALGWILILGIAWAFKLALYWCR